MDNQSQNPPPDAIRAAVDPTGPAGPEPHDPARATVPLEDRDPSLRSPEGPGQEQPRTDLARPDGPDHVPECPGIGEPSAPTARACSVGGRPVEVAYYDYSDEHGKLLYQVVRLDPKGFRQRRPDPDRAGRWIYDMKGVRRVPYRLDLLADLATLNRVYIVEGEKDADLLISEGLEATTNPMGAGKWRDEFSPHLSEMEVVILPDNDEPGREHAEIVARSVHPVAEFVRVVPLPGLREKGDFSDWMAAGGSLDELFRLVESTPAWEPPGVISPAIDGASRPVTAMPVLARAPTAGTRPGGPRRTHHDKAAVIEAMGSEGLLEFAQELGVRLAGDRPDERGRWRCHAVDRPDEDPSATFNDQTGYLFDHGPGQRKLSIFDLAMELDPDEYPHLCTTIDILGDRYLGESDAGTTGPDPVVATTDLLADARRRVFAVVDAKDLQRLYRDAELLAILARLEKADPAAFAGLKSSLSGVKNFRARDFASALVQHRPPGEEPPPEKGKGSDVGRLIELATGDSELFRDPGGRPFALIRDGGRRETLPVRGSAFKQWLKSRSYAATEGVPGAETFRSAVDVLELLAGQGPVHEVYVRFAEVVDPDDESNPTYFLDLADDDRRAVKVTRGGWSVVEDPGVQFRRPPGMKPLPCPVAGGSLEELWGFVNIHGPDRELYKAWLKAAIRPRGPFPILILGGEQGTAKSTTSVVTRRLIDPKSPPCAACRRRSAT